MLYTQLTLGEVIDNLSLGEVAVKVDGQYGKHEKSGLEYLATGLKFDESDHVVKTIDGRDVCFVYTNIKDKYIIMKEENFNKLLSEVLSFYLKDYKEEEL